MTKNIAGTDVDFDSEGFMTKPEQWSRDIATALAAEEGITLTDRHWEVLDFIRSDAKENGGAPNVRRLQKVGNVPTKELYTLFPKGPAKIAARLAGYPKPHGCI